MEFTPFAMMRKTTCDNEQTTIVLPTFSNEQAIGIVSKLIEHHDKPTVKKEMLHLAYTSGIQCCMKDMHGKLVGCLKDKFLSLMDYL